MKRHSGIVWHPGRFAGKTRGALIWAKAEKDTRSCAIGGKDAVGEVKGVDEAVDQRSGVR